MGTLSDTPATSTAVLGLPTHDASVAVESRHPRRLDASRRERATHTTLVSADVTAMLTTAALVTVGPIANWLAAPAFVLVPVFVMLAKLHGLYTRDDAAVTTSTLDEAPALFQLSLALSVLLWLGEQVFVVGPLDHGQAIVFVLLLFVALLVCRALARHALVSVLPGERALLLGDERMFHRLASRVQKRYASPTHLVGRLDVGESLLSQERAPDAPDASLRSLVSDLAIDRVIVAPGSADPDLVAEIVREAGRLGTPVTVVPRVLDLVGSDFVVDDVAGMTVLGVSPGTLSRNSLFIKRTFDLLAAGIVAVLMAPLFALCALAIRLDSPGPIIFRQTRIGRHGEPFTMLKFRTMDADAERRKGALLHRNETRGVFKIAGDPRITRVGRLLRRASLDELPQLLNVLQGQMSVVGPRPLVPDEDRGISGSDRHRLSVPPGVTGPWQVLGSHRVPLDDMSAMDGAYVETWSLWRDIKIILRTVPHVLLRRGL